ncbi:serine/threonine-protein kinase [Glycomyces tenuis]|uniref:serine/threonine-protein kinase n=1 Tax=Glycomyces tenuis TaxID=58116 RepID=UPI000423A3E7|nr:serine/threonine-protein kinase [Glycomyces tenuis]
MLPLAQNDPPFVGPYRVVALLGEGGMGRVYLGVGQDGQRVAVKRILPQLLRDDGFRQRFAMEVDAARKVAGPHTVRVVAADAVSPEPWSATTFVPGPTLIQAVEEAGPLPEGYVRSVGMDLAAALNGIHGAGLIHRDVKPSNVLLSANGAELLDFGVSRAMDYSTSVALTQTGGVVGSPGYMSPEQAEMQELTEKSDVFSLGCLLAMAASGQGPFEGPSIPQVLYKIVHAAPELAGVPDALRAVIERCLAKDPEERPSPLELRRLLEQSGGADATPPEAVRAYTARQEAEVAALLAPPPRQQATLVDDGPTMAQQGFTPMPPPQGRTGRRNALLAAVAAAAALVVIIPLWLIIASGDGSSGSGDDATVAADGGQETSDEAGEGDEEGSEASLAVPEEVCPAIDTDGLLDLVGPGSHVEHIEDGAENGPDFASCSIMAVDGEIGLPTSLLVSVGRITGGTGLELAVCYLEGCDGMEPSPLPFGESTERPWAKGGIVENSVGGYEMIWYEGNLAVWAKPLTTLDDGSDAEAEYLEAQGVALYDYIVEG